MTKDEQRIVEWLRRLRDIHKNIANKNMEQGQPWIDAANVAARYSQIIDAIERGDHKNTDGG